MATRNRGDPRGSGFGSVFIDSTVARAHQHTAGTQEKQARKRLRKAEHQDSYFNAQTVVADKGYDANAFVALMQLVLPR